LTGNGAEASLRTDMLSYYAHATRRTLHAMMTGSMTFSPNLKPCWGGHTWI